MIFIVRVLCHYFRTLLGYYITLNIVHYINIYIYIWDMWYIILYGSFNQSLNHTQASRKRKQILLALYWCALGCNLAQVPSWHWLKDETLICPIGYIGLITFDLFPSDQDDGWRKPWLFSLAWYNDTMRAMSCMYEFSPLCCILLIFQKLQILHFSIICNSKVTVFSFTQKLMIFI